MPLLRHIEGPEEWIVWHPASGGPSKAGIKVQRDDIFVWLNEHNIPYENTYAEGEWWGVSGELEEAEFAEEGYDLDTTDAQAVEIRMRWF